MIVSCESCGEDFLTESDPHVVRPTRNGNKLYCYCHIKGFDEVKGAVGSLESKLAIATEALGEILKPCPTIEKEYRDDMDSDAVSEMYASSTRARREKAREALERIKAL